MSSQVKSSLVKSSQVKSSQVKHISFMFGNWSSQLNYIFKHRPKIKWTDGYLTNSIIILDSTLVVLRTSLFYRLDGWDCQNLSVKWSLVWHKQQLTVSLSFRKQKSTMPIYVWCHCLWQKLAILNGLFIA